MSHGRQPTYDKGRKIVVALGDAASKTNACTAESFTSCSSSNFAAVPAPVKAIVSFPEIIDEVDNESADNSICLYSPPQRSPEVTLTQESSKQLQEQVRFAQELQKTLESLNNYATLSSTSTRSSMTSNSSCVTQAEWSDETLYKLKSLVTKSLMQEHIKSRTVNQLH